MRNFTGKILMVLMVMFMVVSVSAGMAQADYYSFNAGAESNLDGFNGGDVRDTDGSLLPVGSVVQYISTGPNGVIDAPNTDGSPGGDDDLLATRTVGDDTAWYVFSNQPGLFYHLIEGNCTGSFTAYARVWNSASISTASRYGESQVFNISHAVDQPPTPNNTGLTSFTTNQTVAPKVAGITWKPDPTNAGYVYGNIEITGEAFGPNQGTSSLVLSFDGGNTYYTVDPAQIYYWSDTKIEAGVVNKVSTGYAIAGTDVVGEVRVGGKSSSETFALKPKVYSITPDRGIATTTIKINGTAFNPNPAGNTVTIGGVVAPVTSVVMGTNSDTIEVVVPAGLPLGSQDVSITINGMTSNTHYDWDPTKRVAFEVLNDPEINNIVWDNTDPAVGYIYDNLIINGQGFGSTQGTTQLHLLVNGTYMNVPSSKIASWTDTSIKFQVDPKYGIHNLVAGSKTARIVMGSVPTSGAFALYPKVYTLDPTSGAPGSQLKITGTGFSVSAASNNRVYFGGATSLLAQSIVVGDNGIHTLEVTVPNSLAEGVYNIRISTAGGYYSNTTYDGTTTLIDYTVTKPTIDTIVWHTPQAETKLGYAFGTIDINGQDFGATKGTLQFSLDGTNFNMTVPQGNTSWNNTQVSTWIDKQYSGALMRAGTVYVRMTAQSGQVTNVKTFVLKPIIQSITPTAGLTGTIVKIQGLAFPGLTTNAQVQFAGVNATINSVTRTIDLHTLEVVVPTLTPGYKNVTLTVNGQAANTHYVSSTDPNVFSTDVINYNITGYGTFPIRDPRISREADTEHSSVRISWINESAENVKIYALSGPAMASIYTTDPTQWSEMVEVPKGTDFTLDINQVGQGTQKWYKIVPASMALTQSLLTHEVLGKFDINVEPETLFSLPLIPYSTDINKVVGKQLTGGSPATSDKIYGYNGAWQQAFLNGSTDLWQGDLTQISPDQGYWIILASGHPSKYITFVGDLAGSSRNISLRNGPNLLGHAYPVNMSFADTNLNSVLTGGTPATGDKLYSYSSGWSQAFYAGSNVFRGGLTGTSPGRGIWIMNGTGSSDTWNHPKPY